MTAEEQLREMLHSHAETVHPTGDGLQRIQERIERRRPSRWLLPAGGAVVTAGLAAVLALQVSVPRGTDSVVNPGSPAPTVVPTTTAPSTPPYVGPMYDGPAIWPFRSPAEAEAWDPAGPQSWASDPVTTTEHLVSDYLQLTGVTTSAPKSLTPSGALRFSTQLSVGALAVGRVELAQLGAGGPWTVISVGGTDLTITTPDADDRITSPASVSGRVTGVDESIRLDLVTFSGQVIATSFAPAGSEVPWQGSLSWTTSGWSSAAVVGTTRSPRDGSITRVVAVPVLPG